MRLLPLNVQRKCRVLIKTQFSILQVIQNKNSCPTPDHVTGAAGITSEEKSLWSFIPSACSRGRRWWGGGRGGEMKGWWWRVGGSSGLAMLSAGSACRLWWRHPTHMLVLIRVWLLAGASSPWLPSLGGDWNKNVSSIKLSSLFSVSCLTL